MLNAVIRFALVHRRLIVAASLVVLLYGGYLTTSLPIDVFPDLDRPRVVILTECPNWSPADIEARITQPIETTLLGAPGVQAVRSQSSQSMMVVYVEFDWKTDIHVARQVVQERLASASAVLPSGIRPYMTPPTSIMGQFMHIGVHRRKGPGGGELAPIGQTGLLAEQIAGEGNQTITVWRPRDRDRTETWEQVTTSRAEWVGASKSKAMVVVGARTYWFEFRAPLADRLDLRATADWLIRPQLLKIPGVAEVIDMGGDVKQYQVLVDPRKLQEYRVSLQQVEEAIKANNVNSSGGFIEEGETERPVRVIGRLGPLPPDVIDQLRKAPVKTNADRVVRLGHVARIEEGPAPKRGDAGIDGNPGVLITVVKQPHSDTRKLTDAVKNTLRETEASLPADVVISTDLFQLRSFID